MLTFWAFSVLQFVWCCEGTKPVCVKSMLSLVTVFSYGSATFIWIWYCSFSEIWHFNGDQKLHSKSCKTYFSRTGKCFVSLGIFCWKSSFPCRTCTREASSAVGAGGLSHREAAEDLLQKWQIDLLFLHNKQHFRGCGQFCKASRNLTIAMSSAICHQKQRNDARAQFCGHFHCKLCRCTWRTRTMYSDKLFSRVHEISLRVADFLLCANRDLCLYDNSDSFQGCVLSCFWTGVIHIWGD